MSYLATYRKLRPKTFDELVEQTHISTTLKNQIKEGRISHAYLFSGARGTGKTTVAKIFAKAVNCENPTDGSPCGVCPTCKALGGQDAVDIIEIDAASNNGVDDLRDLRDKVSYRPTIAKYKVYIIDEVHMLTISAFNALLKTLEEPPEHVIFILATTEIQKLPETILSRCLKFDFRLITTKSIFEYLKKVLDESKIEYEEEGVYEIAKAGQGAMRDALSVLEVCISGTQEKLTYALVTELVGNLSKDKLYSLFEKIKDGKEKELLILLSEIINSGGAINLIARNMIELIRDVTIVKIADGENILGYPEESITRLYELSEGVEEAFLLSAMDTLSELEGKIKHSISPRTMLECAFLKLANPKNDLSTYALSRKILELEKRLSAGNFNQTNQPQAVERKVEKPSLEKAESTQNSVQNKDVSASPNAQSDFEKIAEKKGFDEEYFDAPKKADKDITLVKGDCLQYFRQSGNMLLFSAFAQNEVTASGKEIKIKTPTKIDMELFKSPNHLKEIEKMKEALGYEKISFELNEVDENIQEERIKKAQSLLGESLKIKK